MTSRLRANAIETAWSIVNSGSPASRSPMGSLLATSTDGAGLALGGGATADDPDLAV